MNKFGALAAFAAALVETTYAIRVNKNDNHPDQGFSELNFDQLSTPFANHPDKADTTDKDTLE